MRRSLVVTALVGVATVSACAPQPDASGCREAPKQVLAVLQGTLAEEAELRNGFTSTAAGLTLVSAELHLTDDRESKKGDVLTFVAAGDSYQAVDRYARRRSSLPDAAFDVRKEGVFHSRACAAANRGS